MIRIAAAILAVVLLAAPARAGESAKCAATALALWGDGRHDDTAALNAWFRGDEVVWGPTGRLVGSEIGGSEPDARVFRLSGPVYISSGTGRRIERFEFIWPQRRERVAGGAIVAGRDPAEPPVAIGIIKENAGPGEGIPYQTPTPKPANDQAGTNCLVS